MHQRGDVKISRRRSSEEGKGECFAPFYLKINDFLIKKTRSRASVGIKKSLDITRKLY